MKSSVNPKCEAKCNEDDINKSLYLATTEDPVANVDSFFTDFPEVCSRIELLVETFQAK